MTPIKSNLEKSNNVNIEQQATYMNNAVEYWEHASLEQTMHYDGRTISLQHVLSCFNMGTVPSRVTGHVS